MIAKIFPVITGLLAVLCLSSPARALDPLPLPNASLTIASAEVQEFVGGQDRVSHDATCAQMLRQQQYASSDEKILAIKAYRQCRADRDLSKLAVWRWRDNTPD